MKSSNVIIVGAGVIGLQTAICILKECRDVSVTVWSDKKGLDTTSSGAGASWTPEIGVGPANDVKEYSYQTLKRLTQLSTNVESGVYLRTGYRFGRDDLPTTGEPAHPQDFHSCGFGDLQLITRSNDKDGVLENPTYKYAWKYIVPCVNMEKYLIYLESQYYKLGGNPIVQKRVGSINEFNNNNCDVVVNCTGLGSFELFKDKDVIPVRGQLVRVQFNPKQSGFHQNNYFLRDKGEHGSTYIYPKGEGIFTMGGTFEIGKFNMEPSTEIAQNILDRCEQMIPQMKIKQNGKVIGHWVGLRPHRKSGIRVEKDLITFDGRVIPVIHNYGHSGSGITMSYGSSLRAAQILNTLLHVGRSKL
ncbi:D-aspartate oxidase [Acrasis kona]|uniref:D-aspartate oxidase n=1 Tax=Acrasis kona TaxID=1008807 RepID=A0AAW2ZPS3_9EUKA